ncbi:MAG TPA: CoA-binding protein [Bacteroidia bacterium]|jgi:predicted CoA-binding protein|nr:CoA-binding protein [Bacteroidia bacterium]
MQHINPSDKEIYELLVNTKTIAMIGASANPEKTSHGIMKKLQSVGYRVIPVNPNETEILGEKCYASLQDIPVKIDLVNVFRKAETTVPIASEAINIHAKALWLQLGIVNEETAAIAKKGGLIVVMDACIAVMHAILKVPNK